jgi:acetylornithine deacetylase
MMGRTARDVKADIENLVEQARQLEGLRGAQLKLEFKGFMADPCIFDQQEPIVQVVRRNFAETAGHELREYKVQALTDGRFFTLYQNTPVACFGPEADLIHGIDESVSLESFHATTRTIALTMAEWCGVEKA